MPESFSFFADGDVDFPAWAAHYLGTTGEADFFQGDVPTESGVCYFYSMDLFSGGSGILRLRLALFA